MKPRKVVAGKHVVVVVTRSRDNRAKPLVCALSNRRHTQLGSRGTGARG